MSDTSNARYHLNPTVISIVKLVKVGRWDSSTYVVQLHKPFGSEMGRSKYEEAIRSENTVMAWLHEVAKPSDGLALAFQRKLIRQGRIVVILRKDVSLPVDDAAI